MVDFEEMKERYPGINGRTQGEINEIIPAVKAAKTVTFSTHSSSSSVEFPRSRPLARLPFATAGDNQGYVLLITNSWGKNLQRNCADNKARGTTKTEGAVLLCGRTRTSDSG